MITLLPVASRISQKSFSLYFFVALFLLALSCQPIQSLGKNPSGEELKKIGALPNYRNGAFQNLDNFPIDSNAVAARKPQWTRLLKYLFRKKPKEARPSKPLPVAITDLVRNDYKTPTVIWFGHSSFLLKTATANI